MIVQVAQATGATVREVAGESYALTLWTWAQVQRLTREDAVERLGDRTDMAGLMAVAFHEPAKLQQAEVRYLAAAGRLDATLRTARARAEAMMAKIAAARPVEEG